MVLRPSLHATYHANCRRNRAAGLNVIMVSPEIQLTASQAASVRAVSVRAVWRL